MFEKTNEKRITDTLAVIENATDLLNLVVRKQISTWVGGMFPWLTLAGRREGPAGQIPPNRPINIRMAAIDPPLLMTQLQRVPGVTARALEWLIVTRCRPDEAVGAAWPEIDAAAKLWRIPAEREKHNRGHVVHLSDEALAILDKVRPLQRDDLLFPKTSKPALANCLKRLSPRATLHGFFAKR